MNDPIAKALEEVGALEGWDALDLNSDAYKKLRDVAEEQGEAIAQAFYETFKTPSGRVVMNRLIAMTLLSPIVRGKSHAEDGIREGRADLVRQILQQIEIGRAL